MVVTCRRFGSNFGISVSASKPLKHPDTAVRKPDMLTTYLARIPELPKWRYTTDADRWAACNGKEPYPSFPLTELRDGSTIKIWKPEPNRSNQQYDLTSRKNAVPIPNTWQPAAMYKQAKASFILRCSCVLFKAHKDMIKIISARKAPRARTHRFWRV